MQKNHASYSSNQYNMQKNHAPNTSNQRNIQKNPASYSSNQYNMHKTIHTCNNSHNKNNTDESLLLNDVYGKKSNVNSCSEIPDTFSSFDSNDSNSTPDISAILNSFFQNNSNSNDTNSTNKSADFNIPDIETMMKFKKIFERLNSKGNDPVVNLLYAIKPFIQESKKSIIDQIAKFMTLSTVLQDFNNFL